VIRFLFGAAEAGFFPGIMFFLTLYFPAKYRGHMVGIFMAASPVSAVIGAPLSTLILGIHDFMGFRGWQLVFILEALPALILGVVTLWYLQDDPSEAHWLSREEADWLVARQAAERRQREARHDLSVMQVLRNPRVLTLGVAGFAIAYSIYGIVYFLPQIVKQFGLTNMQTGLVSAIPFAVGAIGMIWYGRRSDRIMERRSHTSIAFMITAAGLMLTALTPNPYVRLCALSVASFGAFAVLPVFWSMPTAFLSGTAAAAGVAYINSLANIAGFIGPFVMGWIKDTTGSFDGGLLVIGCICIVGAIATLCIHHERELEHHAEARGRGRDRGVSSEPEARPEWRPEPRRSHLLTATTPALKRFQHGWKRWPYGPLSLRGAQRRGNPLKMRTFQEIASHALGLDPRSVRLSQ